MQQQAIQFSTLAGGSGDARVWVLTPAQIVTTQIKTPVNFSGTVELYRRTCGHRKRW